MNEMTQHDSMVPDDKVAKSLFAYADPFELFDSFFADGFPFREPARAPRVDIREEDALYRIEAELPGVAEKDVKIEVKDGVLELSAETDEERDEKDGTKWLRRERSRFSFRRRFGLPEEVDVDGIKAGFRDGLLSIELPKKPEAAPRRIPVKAA